MDKQMTYGDWLREARKRHRPPLRQLDIAEAIGVDRSYIVKIETGKIGLPQRDTRDRIHAALGTTEDDLRTAGVIREHVIHVPTATATATGLPVNVVTTREIAASDTGQAIGTESATVERLAERARLLTAAQRELVMDLVDGIIKLGETPTTQAPERPTRRASGE